MGRLTNCGATTVTSENDAYKIATINGDLQILDDQSGGILSLTTTGGTTTLTGTNDAPQAQHMFLKVSGALVSNAIIVYPIAAGTGRPRILVVQNATSGAFTVTVKASGGTGAAITQGKKCFYLFDGSDYVKLTAEI